MHVPRGGAPARTAPTSGSPPTLAPIAIRPTPETPPAPGAIYPMAFLVEQDAGAIVGAHYHQADQFQVVVGGTGRLGRHDVAAGRRALRRRLVAVRPAVGRCADGLQYFTLRNGWDPGARYMEFPDNRATLRATARRHREATGDIMSPRWAVREAPCPRGGRNRHRTRAINRRGPVLADAVRNAVRWPGPAGTVMRIRVSDRASIPRDCRCGRRAGAAVQYPRR